MYATARSTASVLSRWTALLCMVTSLLAGCVSVPRVPYTPDAVRSWRSVELAVDMVEPAFQPVPGGSGVVAGVPSPAGMALGVVVGSMMMADAQSAARANNALIERLREQLLDIDLPATLRSEVLAHAPPSLGTLLRPASVRIPEASLRPEWDQALSEVARQVRGDGLLVVRAWPMPRSKYLVPGVLVQVRLLDRQGVLLQSADLETLAAGPSVLDRDLQARWWEDGRWRRFVLHALQASAMAITWRLEPDPQAGAREAQFAEMSSADPSLELESSRLRTSVCAVEAGENRPLVHRYERRKLEIRVGTLCADEAGAQLPAGSPSLISRALPAPPLQPTVIVPPPQRTVPPRH